MNTAAAIHLFMAVCFLGCSGSEKYPQLPPDVDLGTVPKQTVTMTAERYTFSPEEVHVKSGSLVTLEVTALDG